MTDDEIAKPHVLIDADPDFTKWLWHRAERKPFILSPNAFTTWQRIGSPVPVDDLPFCFQLPPLPQTSEGLPEQFEEVELFLAGVRDRLALRPGEHLDVAMVGSHGSLVPSEDAAKSLRALHTDADDLPAEDQWARAGRSMVVLVEQALRRIPGLRPVRLATAHPDLLPQTRDPAFDRLAATARSELDALPRPADRVRLPWPATPLMMVRDGASPEWRPMEPPFEGNRQRPYSITAKLIEQFHRERANRPGLRGVLAKLLSDRLDVHSVFDAPVVGARTIEDCQVAGVEAILLDRRCGIVRPVDLPEAFLVPVYAA